MDCSPCTDCAATLSLAARVVAGAASWMPRPNPSPRPSAPADGEAGQMTPVANAAAAADENQLCARLGCGKTGAKQRCSRCKRTQYCDTACQVRELSVAFAPKLHPQLAGDGGAAAMTITARSAKHTLQPCWLTTPCSPAVWYAPAPQRTHWKAGGHKVLCTRIPPPAVVPQHLEMHCRWML